MPLMIFFTLSMAFSMVRGGHSVVATTDTMTGLIMPMGSGCG